MLCFFLLLFSRSLRDLAFLWDNYLATGHEHNTDVVSHRLTVKLAFSLLAANHCLLYVTSCGYIIHMHQLLSAAGFLLCQQEHLLSFAHRPVAAKQLSRDGCLVRWRGHYCGICSNAFITAIKTLHIGDIARTRGSQLSALQTLIWPSQAESEGITKINWVVFKFNTGCMFSLSTGGLLNQSAAWQLNISDE